MCRLFGLAASPHRVHASFWLLEASHSIVDQSLRNPDGTGLGFFDPEGRPVIDKEPIPAAVDRDFAREARHVSSAIFVSHIRHATTGGLTAANTHPFAMDGRVFAHNGVVDDLDLLEENIGDYMDRVEGQTDSERIFALVSKEIHKARGDVATGIAAATRWIAARLPVYSLNFVMATEHELWAFRYPDSEPLFFLERGEGGFHGGRALHHASDRLRVHVPQLADRPAMIVASEPLDENPAWQLLESGELIHVDAELRVTSSRVLTQPPERVLRFRRASASSR